MISLTRNTVAVVLIVFGAGIFSTASPQTKTPKKPAGTITGKVTIKGKAAPGVVVGLRASDVGSNLELLFKATTDQEGKYRLTEIPAGNYQVTPLAPAFLVPDVTASRGKGLVMSDGESVDGIDFALVRGGVVTGKVTDADGRPVIEQRVSLLPADPPLNQRGPIYAVNGVQTDDRGIYRMFGLPAGRYKVAAGQGGDSQYVSVAPGRVSYKQTFSPDTSDPAKAAVVEVTEGGESINVDIVLGRATRNFVVGGRLVNGENDQPVANVRVGLQSLVNGRVAAFMGSVAVSDGGGEFKVENVAPGKYGVFIIPQTDSDVHADVVSFEVVDQDVSGLIVKTSKGSSVAGTVVLESTEDTAVLARLLRFQVLGTVQSAAGTSNFGHSASINADGSFLLTGLDAGAAFLSVGPSQDRSLMKGFTGVRLERDGVVQPRGIELKNGEQITGVRLVISYGTAVVHGAVKLENGALPDGARIFVTVRKQGDAPTNIRQPQLDARSHFILEGLPAGTYDFSASVMMPATIRGRPIRASQQITVTDGANTEVSLVLDMNPTPDPVRP